MLARRGQGALRASQVGQDLALEVDSFNFKLSETLLLEHTPDLVFTEVFVFQNHVSFLVVER
jgi:hypothetical protein